MHWGGAFPSQKCLPGAPGQLGTFPQVIGRSAPWAFLTPGGILSVRNFEPVTPSPKPIASVKKNFVLQLTASLVLSAAAHAQQLDFNPSVMPAAETNWTSAHSDASEGLSAEAQGLPARDMGQRYESPSFGDNHDFIESSSPRSDAQESWGALAFGNTSSDASARSEAENLKYEAEVNTVTWLPSGRLTAIPETKDYAAILGGVAVIGAFLARRRRGDLGVG